VSTILLNFQTECLLLRLTLSHVTHSQPPPLAGDDASLVDAAHEHFTSDIADRMPSPQLRCVRMYMPPAHARACESGLCACVCVCVCACVHVCVCVCACAPPALHGRLSLPSLSLSLSPPSLARDQSRERERERERVRPYK